MRKKSTQSLCAMCDTWYDGTDSDSVRIHQHPEPQSGHPRDQLIASRLPYDEWLKTEDGKEWEKYKCTGDTN